MPGTKIERLTDRRSEAADPPSAMNALEAMMWRAEVEPRLRSPVTIVDVLDSEPDWERLVDAHEWATRFVPRLRDRALEPWWGWGTPEWVPDPHFALRFHLRRQALAGGTTLQDVLDLAAVWSMTPLDRARPPWEALLVTGLPDGRAAYLLKIHHSLADGVGLVQVLDLLHGTSRHHVDHPEPSVDGDDAPSRPELTADRVVERARSAPHVLLGTLGSAADLARRYAARPITGLTRAGALLGSAVRAAAPRQGPSSPLLSGRSLNRRFVARDVDLARLRDAAHAGGGSLNDAFLAVVLGALRRYHASVGAVPATVPAGMPISTREHTDPVGGNHWAGARFAAPLSDADPAERIAHVRRIVRALVDEPVVDGLGLIAPVLAALPSPLLVALQGDATAGNDLQVSNVPGLTRPAYLAGARIVRSYPFGPLPGGALMVALMSHLDTCCVAVNLDPAAITEPERFAACLDDEIAAVLALVTT